MGYEELNPSPQLGNANLSDREEMPSHLSSGYDQDFYSKPHDQLAKLSLFLRGALGHNTDLQPMHLPLDNVSTGFLCRLNKDLHAHFFTAELEECDFGMDI